MTQEGLLTFPCSEENPGFVGEKMTKAFAYLRVSGTGQLDGDGFERQRIAIERYANAHNIRVVRWFEEDISGTADWERRPAFSEMMAVLLNDGVKTVLVESLSRVGRTLRVQECVIADFERKDLTLISVNEPDLLSEDDTRVLMRQMLGAFFEYEKKLLVAKLKGARERKRLREGRCEGRKPFGTRKDEPQILESIQKLAAKGLNYSQIADKLNEDKVPTRANGKWYPATVSRILARY